MNSHRIEQLTGLRFFAALLVFVSHLNWVNSSYFFQKIFKEGYVGVSFFFILSGFLLSLSYKVKIANGLISFNRYVFLRFARLTPLHVATALPFIALAIYHGNFSFITTILNLSYLQSFVPNSHFYFSLNAPSWSLSNEMFFYMCFFLLAVISFRQLCSYTLILFIIIIISAFVITATIGSNVLFGSNSFVHWLFYIFPGFRILEFLFGMVLYEIWNKGYRVNKNFIPLSYVILFTSMYFASLVPEAFRFSLYYLPVSSFFLYAHLTNVSFFTKFYSSKILVLLGNASFAFYLIHQPLIAVFKKLLSSFDLSNFSFFIISLCFISILSVLVYEFYEKKAERLLKKLAYRIS